MSEGNSFADRYANIDPEALETRMAAGGMLPEGFYKAKLNGAKQTTSKQKSTPGWELTFTVTEGPFAGTEVTDTLYDTEHAKSQDRLCLFSLRLGVLKRGGKDNKQIVAVEGKTDFLDVLDTPCVIEVMHEEYKREKDGGIGHSVRLAFGGCYYATDKDALAKVGKPVEAKAAAGAGAKSGETKAASTEPSKNGTPAKKKVDTSQL